MLFHYFFQVKELGATVYDCPCLASDMSKLFSVYWAMGKPGAQVPDHWPPDFATKFNARSPMQLQLNSTPTSVFISVRGYICTVLLYICNGY